jgi:uncharacterized membrane protein YedE/YeeE
MNVSRRHALELAFALASGVVFALGLTISGMANPAKVLAFLDVAGDWDPTLAFVMAGALAVTTPAFRRVLRRRGPWFTSRFVLPTAVRIEPRLVGGAAIFGVGWGLAGLCPGPAITDLVTGNVGIVIFVAGMLGGALLCHWLDPRERASRMREQPAS